MTPQEFCYWLQGFVEVQRPESFTKEQTQMVKDHLKLVFTKITPEPKEKLHPTVKKALEKCLKQIRRREQDRRHGVSIDMNRTYC